MTMAKQTPASKPQGNTPPVTEKPTGNTDVAVKEEHALAESMAGFQEFAGAGLSGLGKDDLSIPFLVILQSGSPQVKRSEGGYIEGAAEGMLFNTVTKEVIDPLKVNVVVIGCAYERHFVEWRIREAGGGFVKQHPADPALMATCLRDEKGRDINRAGNQMNDTRTFYVMMLAEDGSPAPALITMTSTQIKKAKQWLMQQSLLKLKGANNTVYTPPMFASKWKITTVPESNEHGTWMGWAFEHVGYLAGPQDPVFLAAQEFHKSVAAGAVKADLSRANGVDPETGEPPKPRVDDDGIPF